MGFTSQKHPNFGNWWMITLWKIGLLWNCLGGSWYAKVSEVLATLCVDNDWLNDIGTNCDKLPSGWFGTNSSSIVLLIKWGLQCYMVFVCITICSFPEENNDYLKINS